MKPFFLVLVSSILFFNLSAQEIPNSDFENWDQLIWSLNPMDWETNNTQVSTSVLPDSMPYSGELAMRVVPSDFGEISLGSASTTIPLEAIPEALNFYAKWEKYNSLNTVRITFFNNENAFYTETWTANIDESEWVSVSMPLNQIEPIMTHAVIEVEVIIGDLVPDEGWLSIDDISFGEVTGISETSTALFELGPIPCSNQLNLYYDEQRIKNTQVNVFDIEGRLVYHNKISSTIDVGSFENGNYIVQVISGNEIVKKQFTIIH